MSALTQKQKELLGYIKAHQDNSGESPSFDEMREALALRSKSGVHRLVTALEERGFIRRIANRARCIEVVPEPHLPESVMSASTALLAREAKRRGLVLGQLYRDSEGKRRFSEVAA